MKGEPIPEYGDVMTVEEFAGACASGMFNDYDGFGEFSDGNTMSGIDVVPSDVTSGLFDQRWSHVVWFNK